MLAGAGRDSSSKCGRRRPRALDWLEAVSRPSQSSKGIAPQLTSQLAPRKQGRPVLKKTKSCAVQVKLSLP